MSAQIVDTRELMAKAKFYDGYSRFSDKLKRYETWEESVDRVMRMHEEFYSDKADKLNSYIEEVKRAYKDKLILGAQRALQFGGEQIKKHQLKMYNCLGSYVDRPEFFGEVFFALLCGSGTGFSVQKHHIDKLPDIQPRTKMAKIHVIEDSIEGWATALDILMSSYFVGGGKYPEFEQRRVFFDTSKIRPKGAMISGGFKAPGPDGLRLALDRIEHLLQRIVLSGKTKLRPIDAYDIVMHASEAVLSGGIRRSASICLFSHDDEEMINAKTGNWWIDNPQRARSNNSAVIVRSEIKRKEFSEIMNRLKQYGEPGFVFVESTEHLTNPCAEIGFFPQINKKSGWQGCNLSEINGGACNTEELFYKACRAASIIGTLQAGYTDFRFMSEETKKIFEREALIGVSITGWMNNPDVLFNKSVLKKGAKIVVDTNKEVAEILGINQAARTTCVKPSGTASILLQTASGIHPEHSKKYIRNVTMTKDSEVAQAIIKTNPYMVEEANGNPDNVIVSFPIVPKEGSIYKNDLLGIEHLEKVKLVQKYWVEAGTNKELCADDGVRHNVSNTIIVDDWGAVEDYVFKNKNSFSGISFMAEFGDKEYYQAPNTEVIEPQEILDKYGQGGIFASGLIVDGLSAFDNLWVACATAQGYGEDLTLDNTQNSLKRDWVRRFNNFANNYLDGDVKKAEHCLKDVYLLHKWNKIQTHYQDIDWTTELTERKYIDVDTMGAQACYAGSCEISF